MALSRPRFEAGEYRAVLGRILAVHGNIEYLMDRLTHLPQSDTSGVKKVEQFIARYKSGRLERNGIVHSRWFFGADRRGPEFILGIRYSKRKNASGNDATVSIRDVAESERKQDTVQYTLEELKKLLRRDINTMRIGGIAYTTVMMTWAGQQLTEAGGGPQSP